MGAGIPSDVLGSAGSSAGDTVHVHPLGAGTIILDGIVESSEWKNTTRVSDFLQRLPREGADPTEETIVYLTYTRSSLYIGMIAYHRNNPQMVASTMRRDDFEQLVKNEQFVIAIDSFNDERNGYWFSTNPLGAKTDVQFFSEGDVWEINWDGLWFCEAEMFGDGWSVEMEIPFSTLMFEEGDRNIMGINLFRRIIHSNEQLFAPLIPLNYPYGTPNVSAARKYLFGGITSGKNIQVKPYGLSGWTYQSEPQYADHTRTKGGVDLRYNATNNSVFHVTVNPDFAEVEADETRLNFTRFNLFFPEKRDFFLENSGHFSFGIPGETEIFFSRNIGLANDSTGSLVQVPVGGGGRFTGKWGKTDFGVMNVQTGGMGETEPENFGMARFKYGFASRSYVGGIFTSRLSDDLSNLVYGVDLNYYFYRDFGFRGFIASSRGAGESIASSAGSGAYNLEVFRSGERTAFSLSHARIPLHFQPGIGFLARGAYRKWSAAVTQPIYFKGDLVRRLVPSVRLNRYESDTGSLQNEFLNAELSLDFSSEDQLKTYIVREVDHPLLPFELFRGIMVSPGRYGMVSGGLAYSAKPGRRLTGTLDISSGSFYGGNRWILAGGVEWKLNRHLVIYQHYSTNVVHLPNEDFTTHLIRTRGNLAFSPRFTIGGLIQYDNYSRQMGSNIRAHYIFREGTELFLVANAINREPLFSSRRIHVGEPVQGAVFLKFSYNLNL